VLMTAALTDELSRLPLANACCRRAETIALLRFAGAVHQQPGRCSIEVDLDTPWWPAAWESRSGPCTATPPNCRSFLRPGTPPPPATGCG